MICFIFCLLIAFVYCFLGLVVCNVSNKLCHFNEEYRSEVIFLEETGDFICATTFWPGLFAFGFFILLAIYLPKLKLLNLNYYPKKLVDRIFSKMESK